MAEGKTEAPATLTGTQQSNEPTVVIGLRTVIGVSLFIIIINIYTLAFGFGVASVVFFIIAPSGAAALGAVSGSIGVFGTMLVFIRTFILKLIEDYTIEMTDES